MELVRMLVIMEVMLAEWVKMALVNREEEETQVTPTTIMRAWTVAVAVACSWVPTS